MELVTRSQRAFFSVSPCEFGRSNFGAPLHYFPAQAQHHRKGLVIAGTHGDETISQIALSCALRSIAPQYLMHDVVLSINPDGNQLGTRANGHGVDLNRAFPSSNWHAEDTVYRWSSDTDVRDVAIKTGQKSPREPEVTALISLINMLKPAFIISLHEPLNCVDDPVKSELGCWLADVFKLPLVADVGYETPGSFGSWCAEHGIPCVTLELPSITADDAMKEFLRPMTKLLSTSELP
ncbi:murein tripeptide amidase MpaA [Vibrio sp. WJH972]